MGEADQNNKDESIPELPERMDLEWIIIGKKMGLSLEEINAFRIRDLAAYAKIYVGDNDEDIPKKASQTDIDNFFK